MNDDSKNRLDVNEIAKQLSEGRLSRRDLSDSLKGLGIGFGAAFVLGMTGAQAAGAPEAAVALTSTNPALNIIINEATPPAVTEHVPSQYMAYYHRYYTKYYSRYHYSRY
jgi:hypothetical protein